MHDMKRMYDDTVSAAKLCDAPYSEAVIQQMFDTFKGGFSRGAVQFRSTNKSRPRLDVRYEDIGSSERPLDIARNAGLLVDTGGEIDKLMPGFYDHLPYLGDGVDFDAETGFAKLWFFPKGFQPVDSMYDIPGMPESVKAHKWFYDKHKLSLVYILGVDYLNQSMNIYLLFDRPEHHTSAVLQEMTDDLGFDVPDPAMIEYSQPALSAALTYTWDSPKVERICYYVSFPNRAATPTDLDPMVATFVNDVPALADSSYLASWTFGSKGSYLKVENDYTGNVGEVIVSALFPNPSGAD